VPSQTRAPLIRMRDQYHKISNFLSSKNTPLKINPILELKNFNKPLRSANIHTNIAILNNGLFLMHICCFSLHYWGMMRALLGGNCPPKPPKIPNTKLLGRGSSPSIILIRTSECCQTECDTNDSWIKLATATHTSEITMISHSNIIELNILQKKGKILRCNSIISFFQT